MHRASVYLPYIYYNEEPITLHASISTRIQWARRNANEAKWQPMSSIFCCLDRIYITLTRTRHKLDHTNQLTAIHIHYVHGFALLWCSLFLPSFRSFVHHFVCGKQFSRLATSCIDRERKHAFNLLTRTVPRLLRSDRERKRNRVQRCEKR